MSHSPIISERPHCLFHCAPDDDDDVDDDVHDGEDDDHNTDHHHNFDNLNDCYDHFDRCD